VRRFDVFGRRIGVTRVGEEWKAVILGADGKHRHGVEIPSWVEESQLGRYLADLFHESATPERPDVLDLGSGEDPAS
jgi:hypothetical protein